MTDRRADLINVSQRICAWLCLDVFLPNSPQFIESRQHDL